MDKFAIPITLGELSKSELLSLCTVLWDWQLCRTCKANQQCESTQCPGQRFSRLESFFDYYKTISSAYIPEFLSGEKIALRTHQDVCDIIRTITSDILAPKAQLMDRYFAARENSQASMPPMADQHRAFNLAVRVMIMANCSTSSHDPGLVELGTQPTPWRADMSFKQFMEQSFPKTGHPGLAKCTPAGTSDGVSKSEGTAVSYRLHAPVSILVSLQQRLILTTCVYFSKRVQRQLGLEVLDSLQLILFPADQESQSLLLALTTEEGFDPDCRRFESAQYRSEDEMETQYHHFGSRLMDLYEEIENPKPRGLLEK
ncbi:hypothetical protein NA57DRAFT_51334 [Rhizodiscina lignyota]|uniref:Uncharacterized protein n=1 Tax=Rhizodiscina lignyota TaxID=1504668 RepID=A0A9P4ISE9_9PEZI|nr:hypothetical protein NA57DRAFT_51334 [Rhizodiscina lignyota]